MLNMQVRNEAVITPTKEGEGLSRTSPDIPHYTPQADVEGNSSSQKAPFKDDLTALPDHEQTNNAQKAPEFSMSRTQLVAFISITCITQLLSLSAMNQTVAPVILLARYFHVPNPGELSWFSAAYSMSVGTFILPAGELFLSSTSRSF